MKISWAFWWLVNLFWVTVFIILSVIVWVRKVDGSGAVQTVELRLISFAILLIAFIFPTIIQSLWFFVNKLVEKSNKKRLSQ